MFGETNARSLGPARKIVTEVAVLELGGIRIELRQFVKPPTKPYHGDITVAGSAHLALKVADLAQTRKRLEDAGVEFHAPVCLLSRVQPGFWSWCYVRDPDGNTLELGEDGPAKQQLDLMAERVRELRLARGSTLKDVSSRANISMAHLSQIERGESIPSLPTILSVSAALGVSADYFLRPRSDSQVLDETM